MDVLSEVLRWFRVEASSVGRVELSVPWGYVVPKRDSAWFHVVIQGSCVLTREQEPALELGTGEYVLLPHGSQHTMSDDGATHSINLEDFMGEAENITPSNGGNHGCEAVRVGGGGHATSLTEDKGDMMSQAKLMAADRVWIGAVSGRMTNQTMNMEMQQAGFDEAKKFVPRIKTYTDVWD